MLDKFAIQQNKTKQTIRPFLQKNVFQSHSSFYKQKSERKIRFGQFQDVVKCVKEQIRSLQEDTRKTLKKCVPFFCRAGCMVWHFKICQSSSQARRDDIPLALVEGTFLATTNLLAQRLHNIAYGTNLQITLKAFLH